MTLFLHSNMQFEDYQIFVNIFFLVMQSCQARIEKQYETDEH